MLLNWQTGFLGLCGDKVDAIDYQTAEIERLSKEVIVFFPECSGLCKTFK